MESPLEIPREDDLGVDTARTEGSGKDCGGRGEALVREAQARFWGTLCFAEEKVSQREKDECHVVSLYIQNLKYDTSELILKQKQTRGCQGEGGLGREGLGVCKLPYIEWGFPGGTSSKESSCQCRRHSFSLWVRKIPGGGNGTPLQYSYLEKSPMDRGAWQATVHGVTKSQTRLSGWAHTRIYRTDEQQGPPAM